LSLLKRRSGGLERYGDRVEDAVMRIYNKIGKEKEKQMELDNRAEFMKGFLKLSEKSSPKECFKNDQLCNPEIIQAHSIQKNRILSNISEDRHVCQFSFSKDFKHFNMEKIGIRIASTFSGFCQAHDNQIFKPIDKQNYQEGNLQQEFLFAYRALAKECFTKHKVYNATNKLYQFHRTNNLKELTKFWPRYENFSKYLEENIEYWKWYRKGLKDSVKHMEELRNAWNYNLDKENFNKIGTEVITFNQNSNIAASSFFFIQEDFNGNVINNFRPNRYPPVDLKPIYSTIFPQHNQTFVLFSYQKKHKNYFTFIKDQINNQPTELQKIRISKLLIYYVENLYISPSKWKNLEDSVRDYIAKTFLATTPEKQSYIDIRSIQDFNLFIN